MGDRAWVYPAFGHSANDESDYGHPSHRGFQEYIGADPILFPPNEVGVISGTFLESYFAGRSIDPVEYDVFVLENADALYAAPTIHSECPDATVILLAAHRVIGLESYNFDDKDIPESVVRRAERYVDSKLVRWLIQNHTDGVLAVSDFVSDYVSEFTNETPRQTVHPYIQPDLESDLSIQTLQVDGSHAIVVCESRDHKGVDRLVDAWPAVREQYPEATLDVIGSGHPEKYTSTPGVSVRGFVKDLAQAYHDADVYIHPARADAFGVTVVEAMYSGTPAIVTRTTGSRDIVSQVSVNLVAEPTSNSLVDCISWYFEQSANERENLAEDAKEQARPFTESEQLDRFENAYDSLLAKIT